MNEMIRTISLLNTFIALISSAGLSMNLVSIFKTPISQSKEYNLLCWTWLGTFVVSILFTTIIVIRLLYFRQSKHTRISTTTSLSGFVINLTTCIIFDDKTSWEDRSASMGGIFLHCSVYNNDDISLYQRCVLTDATWLSGLLLCFLWLAMFFVAWYSPTQPNSQIYKYQLSDTNQKLQETQQLNTSEPKRIEHFSYLPTKALPSVQQRSSDDDTLYLPIHSNTTTATYNTGNDNTSQHLDEKVQVSDVWFQKFDTSVVSLNAPSSSKSSTYAHSMDLGWMKRLDHHDSNKNESGWQQDGSITTVESRRMVVAHSCPEFNKKRVKTLLTTLPSTPLHY